MSVLVLTDEIRAEIAKVIAFAEAHVTSWETVQAHASGAVTTPICSDPGHQIEVPVGFRCAFSFEMQRVFKCRHLSVSVARPGMLPNEPAMDMLAKAFGFKEGIGGKNVTAYLEGKTAINVVEPCFE